MREEPQNPGRELLTTAALAALAMALWAAWLGWDQHRDLHPDGSSTGPYEAWQVIGLVLSLLPPVYWAASRRRLAAAFVGVPLGLSAAAFYDWSDDGSGLFVLGVGMLAVGSLIATTLFSLLVVSLRRGRGTTPGPH
ncbi:hypothetical protein [Streptomyces sp. RerS4]|uniref:hypothetical protein n=1 Tax=Streptomyces sp. RerS4 TaxID=2942449 RepID=UPI00201C0E70|nr:hypothetical protein [Streptomyces sp. RerS4]UQX05432.1 hypothetical protein M4D82_33690 [Streptomyces sp. RerS4]